MAKDKQVMRRDTEARNRVFSYSLGNVTLSFTLRTDIKQELKDWLELLEAARKDVQAEIDSKKDGKA